MKKPDYFNEIHAAASRRWRQLEDDPELAGPWHQLFKQVQSPRHVLSELLQNADDANATEASVEIDSNGFFVFSHNGDDFTEEHFRSLCRFGYSNKRELHTIGFRGVGFKSVFSLGDSVELLTPTLSVKFFRERFTEPQWYEPNRKQTKTQIKVHIEDKHRLREIEKNLEEWKKSPVSLLFFRRIRKLTIVNSEITWSPDGVGPVTNSEWMSLNGQRDRFLLVRSEEEAFPPESLNEIAQERLLTDQNNVEFPPSRVELVLGAVGRLFVVLPTGVETALPFAINAPFIQDPARLKIKDPEISPTNRWLLKRVGNLASMTLLGWLNNEQLTGQERAEAYKLFPDVDRSDSSLEGICGANVELAFEEGIDNAEILLTEDGTLVRDKKAVAVPRALSEVWPISQCSFFFDKEKRPPLFSGISSVARDCLIRWGLVNLVSQDDVVTVLVKNHLPKPQSWGHLLKLWNYIAPRIHRRSYITNPKVRIFPASGSDVLHSASEVVRLKQGSDLKSVADWQFLSSYLSIVDMSWLQYLEVCENQKIADVQKAHDILDAFLLSDGSKSDEIIDRVSQAFFARDEVDLDDCVRLAQIAASLSVPVGESFKYVAGDLSLKESAVIDPEASLEMILEPEWFAANVLHQEYFRTFSSCTRDEWNSWLRSGKSKLQRTPPLFKTAKRVYGRERLIKEIRSRESGKIASFPYVTEDFVLQDWDFEERHWRYWKKLYETNPQVWCRIVDHLLFETDKLTNEHSSAVVMQVATTGSRQRLSLFPEPVASWVLRLRSLPCFRDSHGNARKPGDLLRRTVATEPLIDVEPFVDKQYDVERNIPLLDLLGVRTTPTGPTRILSSLRSLSLSSAPPVSEVEKWYSRLDVLFDNCSTEDASEIRNAFQNERLILSENGVWETSAGVFLNADDQGLPGAEVVRSSVRHLMLWTKVGVADRPSIELAINWLNTLPSGKPLTKEELRRVQNLLATHPTRVWEECGHWTNLNAEWVAVDDLAYYVSMASLVRYTHLFGNIKQQTADFQKLSAETVSADPFNRLIRLAEVVEKRFLKTDLSSSVAKEKPWLIQLGRDIARIKLEDPDEQLRIRELGKRLAGTKWKIEQSIQVVPYIDGVPAGEAFEEDVAWIEDVIYVKDQPTGKIAKAVSNELCKAIRISELDDAIKLCLERDVDFVAQYMNENFELDSEAGISDAATNANRTETENNSAIDRAFSNEGNSSDLDSGDDDATLEAPSHNVVVYGERSEEIDAELYDRAEEYDDEFLDEGADGEERHVRTGSTRPKRQSLIDRFAEQIGFRRDSDDRFFHSNGSWIAKNTDGIGFQWEHRQSNGTIVRYYYVRELCLEIKPLEIDADVYSLLRSYPNLYSLLIVDPNDDPIELTGEMVDKMKREGQITLLPATYRIVKRR